MSFSKVGLWLDKMKFNRSNAFTGIIMKLNKNLISAFNIPI